jgi:large repetitive protein
LVGNYPVTYRVADAAGNVATVSRTVQVADARAPVLTLNGAGTMTLECGVGSYTEAGATAADACAGNLTSAIVTSGTVNAAARGTYTKSYSVTDASGNVASAARTVSVTDTRAPAISLVGSATMSVNRGSAFVDPGATATDSCSGNLTSAIVRTGTVNTSVAGTYTLTYSATDGAGLRSSVTRTVTVVGSTCNTTVTVKPVQQIWPPNHGYQSFTLSDCAVVTTNCGPDGGGCHGSPAIDQLGTIISIYSDEVEDAQGNGDGSTDDDIVITGPSSFKVRAERQGKGNGRFYGVNFRVTDTGGNTQTATCKFVVPHDQSGRGAVDDGAAAGYTVYR